MDLSCKHSANEKIFFHSYTSYNKVPEITSRSHIGIAIYQKNDVMNSTLGSASNKIYEYAACGLPILYFESEHYKKYLDKYEWAFATDLSEISLRNCIESIASNYEYFSKKAKADFENEFNYEKVFEPVRTFLNFNTVELWSN